MTVDAFLAWGATQPEWPRYELWDGELVMQAGESYAHGVRKFEVAVRLREAIARAGLRCRALGDGMLVRVDHHTSYIPDAMVRCGPDLPPADVIVTDPVIVVEIVSPSSENRDMVWKLEGYFSIPSVQHYLIVRAQDPVLVHHARAADGAFATRIVHRQPLRLDPPGIVLDDWWADGQ